MGSKLLKIRKGDIGEYMANMILSEIAFTTFIPRQEDFGVDFYCGLMRRCGDKLYYDLPFLLQVKTNRKPITYGILNPKKNQTNHRWDKETIDSLFNLNLPFFIGHVDKDNMFLDIHTTSLIWKIHREVQNPSAIEFRFPQININDLCTLPFSTATETINNWEQGNGDGLKHIIDLGQPFLRIKYEDLKIPVNIENYTKILKSITEIELKNITYKISNLPYFKWIHQYTTNDSNIIYGWNVYDETNLNKPLELVNSIREHLLSLAVGLKENNMPEYEAICKVTKLITDKKGFDNLLSKYSDLID